MDQYDDQSGSVNDSEKLAVMDVVDYEPLQSTFPSTDYEAHVAWSESFLGGPSTLAVTYGEAPCRYIRTDVVTE